MLLTGTYSESHTQQSWKRGRVAASPINRSFSRFCGLDGGPNVGRGEVVALAEAIFHLLLGLLDVLLLLLDTQELTVTQQLPAAAQPSKQSCHKHQTSPVSRSVNTVADPLLQQPGCSLTSARIQQQTNRHTYRATAQDNPES